jgi:hypothetical protein
LTKLDADALETFDILESLVHHRQAADRIDDVRIGVDSGEHAREQSDAVTCRKQGDAQGAIVDPVQEENDPGEKQQDRTDLACTACQLMPTQGRALASC